MKYSRLGLLILTTSAAALGCASAGDVGDDSPSASGSGSGAEEALGVGARRHHLARTNATSGASSGSSGGTGGATAGSSDGGAPSGSSGSGSSGSGSSGGSSGSSSGSSASTGSSGSASSGTSSGTSPMLAGCAIYPANNAWNTDISNASLHPNAATYSANMAPTKSLHADWGTFADGYGIPINTGTGNTPVPISWNTSWGAGESDALSCANSSSKFCYPIPTNAQIEGGASSSAGSDRHLLFLDTSGAPSSCTLYELYNTQNYSGSGYVASNGAIFHLGSNALRPDGWTSADAAGLPILPGLVRYDEVVAGAIHHALRFTVASTQQGYVHPATHAAGVSNTAKPPMGLRLRLKSGVTVSGATAEAQTILDAMKHYGVILADNGSDWFISGETDDRWSNIQSGIQSAFSKLHGSDFEAVDTGPISTSNL